MSMNKYMHPRNIYKVPPDFKKLALSYTEFREYAKQDISGKVSIDFKNVNALRALSRALLMRDFDLNVEIPVNKLIPTIPLRLNYLLWIEDLLNIKSHKPVEVFGIDIGTGASCVYPLMAAKKFGWNMIATDSDIESTEYAKKNISQNLLDDKIQVLYMTGDTLLYEMLTNMEKTFQFCMCNPPFFSSTQELHPFFKSRKTSRPHPKNAFCASVNEVVVNGGEKEFIFKLIRESVQFKEKVEIFTTMVGHKSSLAPLKTLLREVNVCSFKQTEFCQGHTTRWGLAWTFCDLDLRTIPTSIKDSKVKNKLPLKYVIPDQKCSLKEMNNNILCLLNELKFEFTECKRNKTSIIYEIIAYTNTWSNQRRKRREKLQKTKSDVIMSPTDSCPGEPNSGMLSVSHNLNTEDVQISKIYDSSNMSELQNTSLKLSEMEIASTTPKRDYEDEDEYYCNKKFKGNNSADNNNYLAKFFMTVKQEDDNCVLELFSLFEGSNRETIHQILQYIKNNLNKT